MQLPGMAAGAVGHLPGRASQTEEKYGMLVSYEGNLMRVGGVCSEFLFDLSALV